MNWQHLTNLSRRYFALSLSNDNTLIKQLIWMRCWQILFFPWVNNHKNNLVKKSKMKKSPSSFFTAFKFDKSQFWQCPSVTKKHHVFNILIWLFHLHQWNLLKESFFWNTSMYFQKIFKKFSQIYILKGWKVSLRYR